MSSLQNFPIVLASNSPRRHQILSDAGFNYSIKSFNVEEIYPDHLRAEEIPLYLAKLKAAPTLNELGDAMLIGADTIVWLDNQVLGKPTDEEDAFQILFKLSGRTHEVITGVYLYRNGVENTFYDITKVTFRDLSNEEIRGYIKKYKPMDKAGAYGIQDWIGLTTVRKIEGCYYNVMGLPMPKLYPYLIAKF